MITQIIYKNNCDWMLKPIPYSNYFFLNDCYWSDNI